ncbi:hypothetical protein [Asanoa siamensis]|uniref:YrhK-like protein n=1 Tax=Asanoa siamensis TaxID=926357 RepID=A0ABQ4D429_9ACTN|nr:hypothetical protein [Asanoa siamensis]GIF78290.1 hypothetical protein Asi02nite_78080 [Asanoa siamensis]
MESRLTAAECLEGLSSQPTPQSRSELPGDADDPRLVSYFWLSGGAVYVISTLFVFADPGSLAFVGVLVGTLVMVATLVVAGTVHVRMLRDLGGTFRRRG